MRILVLGPFNDEHVKMIREAGGADAQIAFFPQGLKGQELLDELLKADVIVGDPDPAVLSQTSNVKLMQSTWAGADAYTHGPFPFPANTKLCNAVGSYGHIISQHAIGELLAITMNLAGYRDLQAKHEWGDLGGNMSLEGTNVLIFGAGNIGGACAKRLMGFDVARIVGVCRNTAEPREHFDRLVTLAEAEVELPEADAVICALPNSAESAGYLDARRLGMLKPGCALVNVGRGNFIDCDALADILEAGAIRGAALDVTDPEPLPADHRLWDEPRCLITPHISGGSFRHPTTTMNICKTACYNIRALREGAPLKNQVL